MFQSVWAWEGIASEANHLTRSRVSGAKPPRKRSPGKPGELVTETMQARDKWDATVINTQSPGSGLETPRRSDTEIVSLVRVAARWSRCHGSGILQRCSQLLLAGTLPHTLGLGHLRVKPAAVPSPAATSHPFHRAPINSRLLSHRAPRQSHAGTATVLVGTESWLRREN